MLQSSPVPATPFERLRAGAGGRTLAIAFALLVEILLLLLLLSLGVGEFPGDEEGTSIKVVNLSPEAAEVEAAEPKQAEDEPQQKQAEPQRPVPEEVPPAPPAEAKVPPLPPMKPSPIPQVPAVQSPPSPARPAPSPKRVYGPPNKGGSPAMRDTERVGTAPNGEPLYAAAWYREPRPDELSGYMATASGPGWGLIACRTAPDYRVEDCVGLAESPRGSQINRAVLAAAWQFKVRPPRLGGRPQVGSWVRIRIDYSIRAR